VKRSASAAKRTPKQTAARTSKPTAKRPAKAAPARGVTRPKKAAKIAKKAAPKRAVAGIRKGAKSAPKRIAKKAAAGKRKVTITMVPPRGARGGRLEPIARYAIKALDPLRKCGAGTSVQFLYRVDESVEGRTTAHLVFFDRHGWYCEHGRTCPAVAPARKYNGHIARAS
jgi:hypothetical protein